MAWIFLVLASLGEILGVMSINLYIKSKRFFWLFMVAFTMSLGFLFLSLALKEIPLGTAYAIWTGLGATGAVLMGIIFFKESASFYRILFLMFIIIGAIGLKIVN